MYTYSSPDSQNNCARDVRLPLSPEEVEALICGSLKETTYMHMSQLQLMLSLTCPKHLRGHAGTSKIKRMVTLETFSICLV